MTDLEALRARVLAAEDEVYRVQQADDYAHTNGAYARAWRVLMEAKRELREAEGKDDNASFNAAAGQAAAAADP